MYNHSERGIILTCLDMSLILSYIIFEKFKKIEKFYGHSTHLYRFSGLHILQISQNTHMYLKI